MNLRHFLRMARWAQIPPSLRQVLLVLAVVVLCLVLFAIERWYGWPDALTPNFVNGRIRL